MQLLEMSTKALASLINILIANAVFTRGSTKEDYADFVVELLTVGYGEHEPPAARVMQDALAKRAFVSLFEVCDPNEKVSVPKLNLCFNKAINALLGQDPEAVRARSSPGAPQKPRHIAATKSGRTGQTGHGRRKQAQDSGSGSGSETDSDTETAAQTEAAKAAKAADGSDEHEQTHAPTESLSAATEPTDSAFEQNAEQAHSTSETATAAPTEAAEAAEAADAPNEPGHTEATADSTERVFEPLGFKGPESDFDRAMDDFAHLLEAEKEPQGLQSPNTAEIAKLAEQAEHAHSSSETGSAESAESAEHSYAPVDVTMHDAADLREAEHTQQTQGLHPRDAGEDASVLLQPEMLEQSRVAVLEEQNAALQNAARIQAVHAAAQDAKIAELMQQARAAAILRAPRPKLTVVRASGSGGVEPKTPKTKKPSFHSGSVTGNTHTATHGRSYKERPMGGVPLCARVQAQSFATTYLGCRKGKGPLIPIKPSRIGKNVFSDIVVFLDDRDDGETQKNKLPRFLVFSDKYSDWKRDAVTHKMVEVPCVRPEFNVSPKALFDFSVSGSNGGVHQARMLAIQNAGTTIGPLGDAALTAYLPSEDEISRTAQWRNAPPPKRLKTTKSARVSDSD